MDVRAWVMGGGYGRVRICGLGQGWESRTLAFVRAVELELAEHVHVEKARGCACKGTRDRSA